MPIARPLSEAECQRFLDHVHTVREQRIKTEWPGATRRPKGIRLSESRNRELDLARKVRRVMHTGPMTAEWLARQLLEDPTLGARIASLNPDSRQLTR